MEHHRNYGFYNFELLDVHSSDREKIEKAFKDGKISEEERWHQVEKLYQYYEKKEQEIVEAEDAEIVRYVEAHKAMDTEAAKESKDSYNPEDEISKHDKYIVDLGHF